jgi:hypothetical protein
VLNDDPAAGDLSSRHAPHVPEPRPAADGRASITRTAIIVSGDAERCLTEGRVAQAGRHLVVTARGGALQLQQILVNRANCDGTLANRASNAPDRTVPYVPHREYSGHAGLEWEEAWTVNGHRADTTSGPVRMNPRSSRSTTSDSQSVRGSAPISTNTAAA